MKKNLLRILSLCFAVALTLSACGGNSTQDGSKGDADATAPAGTEDAVTEDTALENASDAQESSDDGLNLAEDQTLNLVMSANLSTLDINAYGWTIEREIIGETQEGLFRVLVDENGKEVITNAGAESYEVSDDGLTYTFHLRENFWSDGEPVVAQNYVDTFIRELDPSQGYTAVQNYTFVKNATAVYNGEADADELGIRAIDDATLEIELEAPSTEVLSYLVKSGVPIRQDVIDAATNEYGTDYTELVYSGPFVVTAWTPDNILTLEKNPSYWDAEHVYLDKVNFTYVAESGTQATLFDAKQLDVVAYNDDYGADWNAKAEAGEITKTAQPGVSVRWVLFNQNSVSPLVHNAKVRLALSLAIDRQEYVDTIFGRYTPAYNLVPAAITVNGETYNEYDAGTLKDLLEQYNTDEALQALLKEGLDELDYPYNDLSDVVVNYYDQSASTLDQARIEYLAQTWQNRLGITVNTRIQSDGSYMDSDQFDVSQATWSDSTVGGYLSLFDAGNGMPLGGGYRPEEIQDLLASTVGVTDTQTLEETYHAIEKFVLEDGGISPVYWSDLLFYEQNYVKDLQFTNFGLQYEFTHAYIEAH